MHTSIAWADIGFWRAIPDPPKHPSHQPSPSLYFGFPIHKIDGANQKTAKGFQKDSSFNNYTLANFAKLTMNGLQCVPFARLPLVAGDPLVCFPWAIVQVLSTLTCDEPNDASFTHMVSEASAAASIALSMFERLAKFADEKQDGQHIPPVVVITSVGAKTIVWLAYCEIVDDRLRDHNMIRIWEGNITKIWDAVQFCRIIDNLFFWAQHCLKPMVTQYLNQWRCRYCPNVPNMQSQLEKNTNTAELLHRIQDRLSSLGISPGGDLPALIQQAVVLQEVMRSSDKEPKVDSTLKYKKQLSETATETHPRDSTLKAKSSRLPDAREGPDPQTLQEHKAIKQRDGTSDCGSELLVEEITRPEQLLSGKCVAANNPPVSDLEHYNLQPDKAERGSAEPSVLCNKNTVQPKLPLEHETSVIVVSVKDKTSDHQNSKVHEGTKGTHRLHQPSALPHSYHHQLPLVISLLMSLFRSPNHLFFQQRMRTAGTILRYPIRLNQPRENF
ncbi:hypothetical protein BGZ57DRAFT_434042 [Hyaloscypha finlandica]|nr:hypothetical protein BGZ57DRAFT_434042 [Hyaloscypha finlandica]